MGPRDAPEARREAPPLCHPLTSRTRARRFRCHRPHWLGQVFAREVGAFEFRGLGLGLNLMIRKWLSGIFYSN